MIHFEPVDLDSILNADLLYVLSFKNQIKAGNEVTSSVSSIQFKPVLFDPNSLTAHILGSTSVALPLACIFKQKDGKQLKGRTSESGAADRREFSRDITGPSGCSTPQLHTGGRK